MRNPLPLFLDAGTPGMLATGVLKSSKIPAVGIDLGGTSIKAVLVSPTLEVVAHDSVPTDVSSRHALLESIVGLVETVRSGTKFRESDSACRRR